MAGSIRRNGILAAGAACALACLLLAGCRNLFDDLGKDIAEQPAAASAGGGGTSGGHATLTISASAGAAARTALPSFDDDRLEAFTFTLTGTPSSGTERTLGTWESRAAMQAASVAVEPDMWDFTLLAAKDGTAFTGSLSSQAVGTGTTALAFTLSWDATALGGKGGYRFTLDFSTSESTDKVRAASAALYNYETGAEVSSSPAVAIGSGRAEVSDGSVPGGVYRLEVALYGDTGKTALINTWRELVIVTGGFTSTASRTTDTLTALSTLTLELNGGTVTGGTPLVYYPRRTGYTLPADVVKDRAVFMGWYTDSTFSTETKIAEIAAGTTGDVTVYARWIPLDLYIASGGTGDGTTRTTPAATLAQAAALIEEAEAGNEEQATSAAWTVTVSGTVTGTTTLASTLASSIAIKGTDASTDILDGRSSGSVLTISSTASVTLENLTIRNGSAATNGGGIVYKGGTGELTITNCSISGNTASNNGGGIYITGGCAVTLSGTTKIFNNEATMYGGGIYITTDGSSLTINDSVEIGSSSTSNGNKASGGAGINIVKGTVTMNGGTIIGNTTSDNTSGGGGVYICGNGTFAMGGGTISGNSSAAHGGGVYNAGTMYMYGSAVIGDKEKSSAATETSCSNKTGSGGHGGGIYNYQGSLYIGYIDKSHSDPSFKGGVFYNYSEYQGGGIYNHNETTDADGSSVIMLSGGGINYNGSKYDGGGVRLGGKKDTFTMSGGTITGNKSDNHGDGIFIGGNSFVYMSGGAEVSQNNDVYLRSSAYITITRALTAATPVATITPETYAEGTKVLALDTGATTTLENERGKFSVTPNGSTWTINPSGTLQQQP